MQIAIEGSGDKKKMLRTLKKIHYDAAICDPPLPQGLNHEALRLFIASQLINLLNPNIITTCGFGTLWGMARLNFFKTGHPDFVVLMSEIQEAFISNSNQFTFSIIMDSSLDDFNKNFGIDACITLFYNTYKPPTGK